MIQCLDILSGVRCELGIGHADLEPSDPGYSAKHLGGGRFWGSADIPRPAWMAAALEDLAAHGRVARKELTHG